MLQINSGSNSRECHHHKRADDWEVQFKLRCHVACQGSV